MRYQASIVLPGYNALKVANAPTIGTATAGANQVSVAFTAPSCVGGGAISSYTAFANCGIKTTSGASSPLVVTGLTTGTAYTFKVIATNAFGPSYPSAASNSATPIAQGQQAYITAGTYSWVAPACVTRVSVVAVGGGGNGNISGNGAGGGGGALAYKNNITVVSGSSYTVVVGNSGQSSCFTASFGTATAGGGGQGGAYNSGTSGAAGVRSGVTDGGGNGGIGPIQSGGQSRNGGGGGAAGYSGNGGTGGAYFGGGNAYAGNPPASGSGGAAGGGEQGAGGGVGILGKGSCGAVSTAVVCGLIGYGQGGGGGSGGANGNNGVSGGSGIGGLYGGGGAGGLSNASGGSGAVRIIWPGTTRSFPSTCTGDL